VRAKDDERLRNEKLSHARDVREQGVSSTVLEVRALLGIFKLAMQPDPDGAPREVAREAEVITGREPNRARRQREDHVVLTEASVLPHVAREKRVERGPAERRAAPNVVDERSG
jgi:hypothetical protein